MPEQDRRTVFKQEVLRASGVSDLRESYGLSNVARFIEGGLLVGVPNLDGLNDSTSALALISKLSLAPDIEFYLAVVIQDDVNTLRQRLKDMVKEAELEKASGSGDTFYGERNNNCSIFLGSDGKCYTRNKKASGDESLTEMLPKLGTGIAVNSVYYSVYKPTLATRSHPSVQGIVDQLGQMVGRARLFELHPWIISMEITAKMRRMPSNLNPKDIVAGIETLGGKYKEEVLERYHNGLNYLPHKHFVILSGISGTGKTSLARRYAYVVHGIESLTYKDPLFFLSAVRPDWTDPVGLLGYYDVFTSRYNVPTFLEAIFVANAQPDSPVFFCLDEMNIAKVEYYFADVLSAMETGLPIKLHSSEIALPGDNGVLVPSHVSWPKNLFITGTINIDETTNSISDKVLDRGIVIDLSDVDFSKVCEALSKESQSLSRSVDECKPVLGKVYTILDEHQMAFGYRAIAEVVRYHSFATQHGTPGANVLDHQLVQKVLTKLKGTEAQRTMLESLTTVLSAYPDSMKLLARLTMELNELGSFQANR